jgi:hypothetical protein
MDETGFQIGCGGNQWIITMEWDKHQNSPSESSRDYATLAECISADGEVVPPMLVIQGINHLHQWYTLSELPDNYLMARSSSGYVNDSLSLE